MELFITLIFLLTPYIIAGVLIGIDISRLRKRSKRKSLEELLRKLADAKPLDSSKIDRMKLHKWRRGNSDLPFDL